MGSFQWTCLGKSVLGSSHERNGLPNQDAISWLPSPEEQEQDLRAKSSKSLAVMAVADGHGSEQCKRSDIGSTLAVNIALKEISSSADLIRERLGAVDRVQQSAIQTNSIIRLIRKSHIPTIVESWQSSVRQHLNENPLDDVALTDDKQLLLYGSTLIAVAICDSFGIFMQLGDGDLLAVGEDQQVTMPLAASSEKIGDETESLCMSKAAEQFRVKLELYDEENPPPKTLLICTDGVTNAFRSTDGLLQVGKDLSEMLEKVGGIQLVQNSLETWLQDYSKYSGDDVTLGIIQRAKGEIPPKRLLPRFNIWKHW